MSNAHFEPLLSKLANLKPLSCTICVACCGTVTKLDALSIAQHLYTELQYPGKGNLDSQLY